MYMLHYVTQNKADCCLPIGTGHKKWVPLEIGPPPHPKPHRSKSSANGRDRPLRERRERRSDDRSDHQSGGENNHSDSGHPRGHRHHDQDTGGFYPRRGRGRGRGARGAFHGTRSRSQTDQYHDDLPADIAFYVDYSPVALTGPIPITPFVGPFYLPTLPPAIDNEALKTQLKKQIEYYFSDENLQRDFFLRRKMDANGFLPISLIASFHRVQALTQDVQKVIDALKDSTVVQVVDNIKVGTKVNPEKWPLVSRELLIVLVSANLCS